MTKIISISNHKGGTGKTTTTLNLGRALSLQGNTVLIIDLDPQTNLTTILGVTPEQSLVGVYMDKQPLPIHSILKNFDLVPSELDLTIVEPSIHGDISKVTRLKTALRNSDYDFVLIDCPPSLSSLTLSAFVASNYVLVPVESQFLATHGLMRIIETIEQLQEGLNPHLDLLGLVMTMADNTRLSADTISSVSEIFQEKVFSTTIRRNIALAESPTMSQTIFEYASNSNGAKDYKKLAQELLNRV